MKDTFVNSIAFFILSFVIYAVITKKMYFPAKRHFKSNDSELLDQGFNAVEDRRDNKFLQKMEAVIYPHMFSIIL